MIHLPIDPCPAPRQTRSDAWKQRPAVMRYRRFRDELKELLPPEFKFIDGMEIIFFIPMPDSWSNKKKALMDHTHHKQKPDLDNLCKAFFDTLFKDEDDSCVSAFTASKYWSSKGGIIVGFQNKNTITL